MVRTTWTAGHGHAIDGLIVDRDAAAVIDNGDGIVDMDGDVDAGGVAGEGFIDGVVDDLVDEVMEALLAGGADVHGGALADGRKAFENGDVFSGIAGAGNGCVGSKVFSGQNGRGHVFSRNPATVANELAGRFKCPVSYEIRRTTERPGNILVYHLDPLFRGGRLPPERVGRREVPPGKANIADVDLSCAAPSKDLSPAAGRGWACRRGVRPDVLQAMEPVAPLRRIPELDGLRGIAAIMVFFHHACFTTIHGAGWPLPVELLRRASVYGANFALACVLSGVNYFLPTRSLPWVACNAALAMTGISLGCLSIVGVLVFRSGRWWLGIFRNRTLVFFGLISYAFYMVHLYVIRAYDLRWAVPVAPQVERFSLRFLVTFAGSVALATLSRYLLELPVMRLRRRIPALRQPAGPRTGGFQLPDANSLVD